MGSRLLKNTGGVEITNRTNVKNRATEYPRRLLTSSVTFTYHAVSFGKLKNPNYPLLRPIIHQNVY